MAQFNSQALGYLFVSSYDSQGYCGGSDRVRKKFELPSTLAILFLAASDPHYTNSD
jgi:hypothetical protein